jgi:hypothetical protein
MRVLLGEFIYNINGEAEVGNRGLHSFAMANDNTIDRTKNLKTTIYIVLLKL